MGKQGKKKVLTRRNRRNQEQQQTLDYVSFDIVKMLEQFSHEELRCRYMLAQATMYSINLITMHTFSREAVMAAALSIKNYATEALLLKDRVISYHCGREELPNFSEIIAGYDDLMPDMDMSRIPFFLFDGNPLFWVPDLPPAPKEFDKLPIEEMEYRFNLAFRTTEGFWLPKKIPLGVLDAEAFIRAEWEGTVFTGKSDKAGPSKDETSKGKEGDSVKEGLDSGKNSDLSDRDSGDDSQLDELVVWKKRPNGKLGPSYAIRDPELMNQILKNIRDIPQVRSLASTV